MILTRRLLLAALAAAPVVARAQSDGRPVRIVIGFPPGGGIDSVARIMAPKLSEALKQPVIVENKPGANGLLAMESVAKSAADGSTLFIGTSGNLAMTGAFYPNAPVRIERDFVPVAQVASLPFLLVANPSVPAANVAELVAYAKTRPGQLNYSSSGNGSTLHLAGELFKQQARVFILHIPYRGTVPAAQDVAAGNVDMIFGALPSVMPLVRAGKLRALAVTTPRRSAAFPELPTIAEAGAGLGLEKYEVSPWFGVFAPGATPPEVQERYSAAVRQAVADPAVAEQLARQGAEATTNTPAEFRRRLQDEIAKWAAVVKFANVKPD